MKRVITVMHRNPWKLKQDSESIEFELEGSHHSQFAGLYSLKGEYDVVFIGSMISESPLGQDVAKALWEQHNSILVNVESNLAKGHYEGYCKSVLWPLFHYVLWDAATAGTVERNQWEQYEKVNQLFADAVASVYKPGDLICIQGYHLVYIVKKMLVPKILKQKLDNPTVGIFLHAPFPSSEVFRCLPRRKEILDGILGSQLIGFQTYSHARHFISACTRVLGCESSPSGVEHNGSHTQIGIFPVGIDLMRTNGYIQCPAVQEKMLQIKELFKGKRIIVGSDAMEHTKGVKQKLLAFEYFLEKYPEWINHVALVQVSNPSSSNDVQTQRNVSELISKINGSFGSLEYVPVHHYHHNLDPEEYYALLCLADVALVTPLRDGMNTTSHDYIACQSKNQGVLILSEFTGTAGAMAGIMN